MCGGGQRPASGPKGRGGDDASVLRLLLAPMTRTLFVSRKRPVASSLRGPLSPWGNIQFVTTSLDGELSQANGGIVSGNFRAQFAHGRCCASPLWEIADASQRAGQFGNWGGCAPNQALSLAARRRGPTRFFRRRRMWRWIRTTTITLRGVHFVRPKSINQGRNSGGGELGGQRERGRRDAEWN